jgi:hypothetical protein
MIGGKGIGVYGGFDMHGKPRNVSWTKLANSAFRGSNTITLEKSVDWEANEEIVITTTSYRPTQTETFKISSVSLDRRTLTLNSSLKFDHLVVSEDFTTGASYKIAAAVGLLSRNIKVIGSEYDQQYSDLYGFRILVSDYSNSILENGVNVPKYYKGYVKFSNVEFVHPGQFSRFGIKLKIKN